MGTYFFFPSICQFVPYTLKQILRKHLPTKYENPLVRPSTLNYKRQPLYSWKKIDFVFGFIFCHSWQHQTALFRAPRLKGSACATIGPIWLHASARHSSFQCSPCLSCFPAGWPPSRHYTSLEAGKTVHTLMPSGYSRGLPNVCQFPRG